MIIVDQALARREAEGRPIRVAMVGAGFMGRGVALQILTATPGMELVAVSNRHLDAILTCDDVDVPSGRLCDRLRAEQDERFVGTGLRPAHGSLHGRV